MNPKDHREFPRTGTNSHYLEITLKAGSSKSFTQIKCRMVNISIGGLQIETPYPIESQEVQLRVNDLEIEPNVIRARIVYCERIAAGQFYIGLAFIGSNMDKYNFFSQLFKLDNEMISLGINTTQSALIQSSAMDRISDQ
jgi:hypothetical protein